MFKMKKLLEEIEIEFTPHLNALGAILHVYPNILMVPYIFDPQIAIKIQWFHLASQCLDKVTLWYFSFTW